MSGSGGQSEGGGCAALIAAAIVLGLVIAAGISIAAIIDPFSWLPPVAEVWADCEDDWKTSKDECDLAVRFPGFWPHVIANVAYAAAATLLVLMLAGTVPDLREGRAQRFSGAEAIERYVRARNHMVLLGVMTAVLAALPVVVALV